MFMTFDSDLNFDSNSWMEHLSSNQKL